MAAYFWMIKMSITAHFSVKLWTPFFYVASASYLSILLPSETIVLLINSSYE